MPNKKRITIAPGIHIAVPRTKIRPFTLREQAEIMRMLSVVPAAMAPVLARTRDPELAEKLLAAALAIVTEEIEELLCPLASAARKRRRKRGRR